jgi:hypothetical protein
VFAVDVAGSCGSCRSQRRPTTWRASSTSAAGHERRRERRLTHSCRRSGTASCGFSSAEHAGLVRCADRAVRQTCVRPAKIGPKDRCAQLDKRPAGRHQAPQLCFRAPTHRVPRCMVRRHPHRRATRHRFVCSTRRRGGRSGSRRQRRACT